MCANGSPGCDLAGERQIGRPHRVVQLGVGDHHVEDRLRAVGDLVPDADGLEQPPRRGRDRRSARIAGVAVAERRIGDRHREGIAEPLAQRDGERQPGKARRRRSAHRRSGLVSFVVRHGGSIPLAVTVRFMSSVAGPALHPRSRTARNEPVPRRQPAGRDGSACSAARWSARRWSRPPAPSRACCRIRCTPISCSAAIPRCRSSTRSTASATARASPPGASSPSSTARRSSRSSVSFHNDEPGLSHQMPMPDVPHPDAAAERRRGQGENPAGAARAGAQLLRARAADRIAAGRFRPLHSASRSRTIASTSGCGPPRRCRTIRRSIAARWPMPRT